jgi:hypothetical protein
MIYEINTSLINKISIISDRVTVYFVGSRVLPIAD